MKVWDTRTAICRAAFQGHTDAVTSVNLSQDGSTVVSGSWDNTVKVWDVRTGTCRATLQGHTDWLERVSFSANASRVVSESKDDLVKVWEVEKFLDGQWYVCRATYPRFSPEGRAVSQCDSTRNDAVQCAIDLQGSLRFPDSDDANTLIVFGPFDQAYGPLVDDKILAFNGKGEAFWFQIRRRDGV